MTSSSFSMLSSAADKLVDSGAPLVASSTGVWQSLVTSVETPADTIDFSSAKSTAAVDDTFSFNSSPTSSSFSFSKVVFNGVVASVSTPTSSSFSFSKVVFNSVVSSVFVALTFATDGCNPDGSSSASSPSSFSKVVFNTLL